MVPCWPPTDSGEAGGMHSVRPPNKPKPHFAITPGCNTRWNYYEREYMSFLFCSKTRGGTFQWTQIQEVSVPYSEWTCSKWPEIACSVRVLDVCTATPPWHEMLHSLCNLLMTAKIWDESCSISLKELQLCWPLTQFRACESQFHALW